MAMNVDSFIHHPLFVNLDIDKENDNVCWSCKEEIPNKERYEYQNTECIGGCYETEDRVIEWADNLNMTSHHGVCGVIDTLNYRIFGVDMVLEKDKQLILLIMYYSEKKTGRHWKAMAKYCKDVMRVCVTQYALRPRLALINLFNEDKKRVRWFSHISVEGSSGAGRFPEVNVSDSSIKP